MTAWEYIKALAVWSGFLAVLLVALYFVLR